ncbi:TPA: hypothetical protein OUE74_004291 [Enterobacter roggenkampii]|nr:hypothetical protein [Enterobacter roggenkampii]
MALTLLAANNAQTVLAAGISASATSMTVNSGTGSLFPAPSAGVSFFKLTLIDAATGQLTEIVHVTARSGDTMTIDRAQEGTTARAWSANDIAANMMTAGTLSYLLTNFQPLDATLTAIAALTGAANKLAYFNGPDTAALTDLTSVGRDIIGKNTIADILTYLGLGEMPIIAKYGSALIGELVHWPMQQMPQEIWTDMKMEFIPYMGQSFDGSKYPLLAQLHPSLRLPADMRGEFVRGWDNGRGINTGQQLMSWSADSFKSHNHTPTTGSFFTFVATGGGQLVSGSNNPNVTIVQTTNSVGGAETRPRSVAWNFIVRAK